MHGVDEGQVLPNFYLAMTDASSMSLVGSTGVALSRGGSRPTMDSEPQHKLR